jgi:hypothetical protein
MRNYIFEFDQEVVLRLGLKLNELLFLDYAQNLLIAEIWGTSF